ncbi:MAG: glycosyltransferase family 4 protein [Anaerolineae bacterium]|nr:glycosyltransferase family 4 protein [Anaerolineae bacterium]
MIAPTSFFADYGCHVRILEETRALEKRGHQVTICTYHTGRDLPGLDVRRTLSIPWRRGYEVGSSRHKIAFDLLLLARSLGDALRVRPHLIHAHLHEGALIGYFLSKLWRVPLVFDFQGSLTSEMVDHHFLSPDGLFYKPMLWLERLIDRLSPHILTSSAHAARLLQDEFGCSADKITCVPDCVNVEAFRPLPRDEAWRRRKRAWGIPLGRQVVVYLGLLAEYQGTDHLLQAAQYICRRWEDVHFIVAGYPHVERYQRMAQELGIADHVTFTGRVPYEQAPLLLSLGDVAVSPKLSRTEGAGKLLNYMAMGLPTVTFDTPVSREYLGPYGVYAARGDSRSLAHCLEDLLSSPEKREQLGQALRQRAEESYSWDLGVQLVLETYARALAP